jgi:DedD protein
MPNVSAAAENADQLRRRANRRLLGASVLLLIAIILVPIFLEREPPPLPDNVDVKIPPVEGTKFDPKLPDRKAVPTEVPSITEPTGPQTLATSPAPTAAQSTVQPPATSPDLTGREASKTKDSVNTKDSMVAQKIGAVPPKADSPKSAPAPAPTPAPAATASSNEKPALKSGQLVVQLIAVRDPASAKEAFDKAKALKMPAYTEQITVSNGKVTRVRVGPFDDKQAAEATRAKLARAGFEAKVITLP